MLQLYDLNHNKIAPLLNYKDLKRERETVKGDDILSFSYPKKEDHDINQECYIRTKENEYVIKEVENSDPNWITIKAKVNTEGLKSKIFSNFEVVNSYIADALNLALVGTGWSIGHNDITRRRTVRKSNSTSLEVIEEIRSVYQAEIYFDALLKKINVFESRGADQGEFFIEKLNLKELSISSDSYNYITRLIPIGKDGLTITDINDGKNYVENYQYSTKIIYAVWEDNRYEDAQNLKDDAIKKLEENSQPYRSYQASVTRLGNIDLGDTVTLISKDNKVKEKKRVVKITQYLKEPWKDTVEIANKIEKFEVQQAKIRDAANTVESITTSDGMLDDSKINFDPIRQEFQTIVSAYALFTDLSAANARIGILEATSATVTQLDVVTADIEDLYSMSATVTDLTAATARIGIMEVDTANINTILSKAVFAELAEFGQILAGSSIIAQGAIGSAQISNLSASKLSAGIADLAIVTIQGTDGRLKIANNLLQVFAGTTTLFERIALGDVNGDGTVYGLRIRGTDGTTVLFDENGQTKEGFTDGYSKLTDNSLSPAKLDIGQVVTRINNGTTTIDSSKIYMDDKTLEIAFSEISNTVISHDETITSQGSSITALNNAIILKVDTQTYDNKMSSLDGSISTINSTLSTQSSSISVLQGEIVNKVTQTEIDNSINVVQEKVDGLDSRVRNLFNKNTANMGKYLNNTGGEVSSSGWFYSDYIYVYGMTELTARGFTNIGIVPSVCYYDNNKTLVTAINNNGESKGAHMTIDPGIHYIRFSCAITGDALNLLKIEEDLYKTTINTTQDIANTANSLAQSNQTRISTAESTLTQHATDITARVTTSTYNTKMSALDGSISSLDSRLDSAELKITDSAITATVRNSTEYIGDLNTKANQSALDTTNSNLNALDTRVDTAESTITQHSTDISLRVLTSTYTSGLATKEATIYKQSTAPTHSNGRLWLDTSVTPNQLKRSTGTAWVKGTPSTASEVGAYSASDGSSLASRVSSAELKITDSAIVSTVRTSSLYISDLDNKVSSSEIISEINQSAEVIKIQASKINLVGAVTVLSDIAGNLGTITAGEITGATIKTSSGSNRIQLDTNSLKSYAIGVLRVNVDYDSIDFYDSYGTETGHIGADALDEFQRTFKLSTPTATDEDIYNNMLLSSRNVKLESVSNNGYSFMNMHETGMRVESNYAFLANKVLVDAYYYGVGIMKEWEQGQLDVGGSIYAQGLQLRTEGTVAIELRSMNGGVVHIDFSRDGIEDFGVRLMHESPQRLALYGHLDITGQLDAHQGAKTRGNYGNPMNFYGDDSGTANACYLGFMDINDVRHGYIGYGSRTDNGLTLANDRGGGALKIDGGVVDTSGLAVNGLRVVSDEAPSTYNLDTLYTTGRYWFGNTAVGRPTSYGIVEVKVGCGGFVWNGVGNWIWQIAYSVDGTIFERHRINAGAWSAWRTV